MICDTLKAKERWLAVDLNLHQAGLKCKKKDSLFLHQRSIDHLDRKCSSN